MFLLDTNVISDLRKLDTAKGNVNLAKWVVAHSYDEHFISAITMVELEMGVQQMERKDPQQGKVLRRWLIDHVAKPFDGRILPFETEAAWTCASFHVPKPAAFRDSLIGATASLNGLTIVTRNVKDFKSMNVPMINPYV